MKVKISVQIIPYFVKLFLDSVSVNDSSQGGNEMVKFLCKVCNLEISETVTELRDWHLITEKDGHDYIPKGFYLIKEESSIILNSKDLTNSKYHSDPRRLNGCCGLDGCDGMNRVCLNGHEIATEYSDCWTYHRVVLNMQNVKIL